MTFIIGLYLLVDVLQHKGQTRVLFPKDFMEVEQPLLQPQSKSTLVVKNKNWKKAVNTREMLNRLVPGDAGFECDVYFDTASQTFGVHHDPGKNTAYKLDSLLDFYQQKKLQASIWLDVKNMHEWNATAILHSLITLRNKYHLQNKILVESPGANLLATFSDSGFFTSYYVPFFNPYQTNEKATKFWVDSIASVTKKAKVNALSGYYFQYVFLKRYFPQYPVLTWVDNSAFSFVNVLFQRKIASDKSVLIALKP